MVGKIDLHESKIGTALLISALLLSVQVQAGKLAIVIDDVGYRPHEENAVLQMPIAVSVAVLPNAPHAQLMATKAHRQGREVLIHLPMAPFSKQPLERDTLQPSMSSEEIQRIIRNAVNNVPYAVGMNNHMGSAMTANLQGMQRVMQALDRYPLYFLDSMTIGNSQAMRAAVGTHVKVIKRQVFLDDTANPDDIRRQFNRAVALARKNGSAIAIGHPRPATVKVLQQMLASLPSDIVLVKPSALLAKAQQHEVKSKSPAEPRQTPPKNPFTDNIKQSEKPGAEDKIDASKLFAMMAESVETSSVMVLLKHQWQYWFGTEQLPPQA